MQQGRQFTRLSSWQILPPLRANRTGKLSEREPLTLSYPVLPGAVALEWPASCTHTRQMLPSSHQAPTFHLPPSDQSPNRDGSAVLAEAFAEFIGVSAKLEDSFRELQREVAQLNLELAARNAALETSLEENEGIRLALVDVVDSMPCGVLVLGRAGRVLRMNPEACRLLAIVPEPGSSAALADVAQSAGVDLVSLSAIEGESELCLPTKEKGKRWLQLRTRRLPGKPSGVEAILILSDASAHKQAEQDREAGRQAVALAEVAATLAHEIRNPLTSLELFVSLMEDDPARAGEWLSHLRAGLRKMGGTVNNVLSFHGGAFPLLRPVPLGRAIAEAAEFVRPITDQAGLTLVVAGETLPVSVMANEAGLQQIVLNLVMNAVRHTEPGGTVSLAVSQPRPKHARLEVRDSGSGIAAEHLRDIFQAGWSAAGERSGLGLAVCQRIAAQCGSVIEVASVAGEGATFLMELRIL